MDGTSSHQHRAGIAYIDRRRMSRFLRTISSEMVLAECNLSLTQAKDEQIQELTGQLAAMRQQLAQSQEASPVPVRLGASGADISPDSPRASATAPDLEVDSSANVSCLIWRLRTFFKLVLHEDIQFLLVRLQRSYKLHTVYLACSEADA